jgi:hypothetical protein
MYSEIALSRKPFGIGHMYIHYTLFLLRMTNNMTSQNSDISSRDRHIRILELHVKLETVGGHKEPDL